MSHGMPFDVDGMKALALTRREYLSMSDLDTLLDAIPLLCDEVKMVDDLIERERAALAESRRLLAEVERLTEARDRLQQLWEYHEERHCCPEHKAERDALRAKVAAVERLRDAYRALLGPNDGGEVLAYVAVDLDAALATEATP